MARSLRSVLIATYVCLGLSALLNVESLQSSAGLMEHGASREAAVGVVEPIASLSAALGLDRPHAALNAMARSLSDGAVVSAAELAFSSQPPAPAVAEVAPIDADPVVEEITEEIVEEVPEETGGLPARERRAISAQAPLRVWALGDSLLTLPAFELQQRLYGTGMSWAVHESKHSTGLARPDNFDWPGSVEERLATGSPDVAIFMFGANDGTAMVVNQPYKFLPLEEEHWASADGEWAEEYGKRVGALMDRLTGVGAEVIWVGIPPVRDEIRENHCVVLNQVFEEQASTRPNVTFIDTRPMFSEGDEGYLSALTDDDGERVQVRNPDGVHLNEAGATILSKHLFTLLDDAWALTPK